jgi:hypothetical protein
MYLIYKLKTQKLGQLNLLSTSTTAASAYFSAPMCLFIGYSFFRLQLVLPLLQTRALATAPFLALNVAVMIF